MTQKISPDDPRLTAYALGELEGEERAEVERGLHSDPAARRLVAEIRAVSVDVVAALDRETGVRAPMQSDPYRAARRRKLLTFPGIAVIVSGLAAACLALVLALQETPKQPAAQTKRYAAVPIATVENDQLEPSVITDATDDDVNASNSSGPAAPLVVVEKSFDVRASGLLNPPKYVAEFPRNNVEVTTPVPPLVFSFNYAASQNWSAEAQRIDSLIKRSQGNNAIASLHPSPRVTESARATTKKAATPGGRADAAMVVVNDEPIVMSPFLVEMSAPRGRGFWSWLMSRNARRQGTYTYRRESEFVRASEAPVSSFAVDVDTASYAEVRRALRSGKRPATDAVRIEELLNYFPYAYAAPKNNEVPFSATVEVTEAPWASGHRLVRIGLRGRDIETARRGTANLVFLLDVSASMQDSDRLPMLKASIASFVGRLRPEDRIAIVTYAGAGGVALPSTPVAQRNDIVAGLNELQPVSPLNGAAGIQLAYEIARENFVSGGVNRVILCTDGDFNVGAGDAGALNRLVAEKAAAGVSLTLFGLGMGNLKDAMMQQLADRGKGTCGYIGSERDAEALLQAQVDGAVVSIARNMKVELEFNPARIVSYRLLGYEKRALSGSGFGVENVEPGELGAKQSVTALYEIVPRKDAPMATVAAKTPDELRYVGFGGAPLTMRGSRPEVANEMLTLRVRYKEAAAFMSRKVEYHLADAHRSFEQSSADMKFTAAVAGFGMILRDSAHKGTATLNEVARWADAGARNDPGGYRAEFIALLHKAHEVL